MGSFNQMDTSATSEKKHVMLGASEARTKLAGVPTASDHGDDVENAALHANSNGGDSKRKEATAVVKPSPAPQSDANSKIKAEAASPAASTSCSDRSDQCSPTATAGMGMTDGQLAGVAGAPLTSDGMLGFDAAAAYSAINMKDIPFDARLLCDPSWGAYESPQSVYAMLLSSSPGALGQLLPPPAISTSGLLPSPTASSFLMHQLQQQQQQQMELQQQCGMPNNVENADGGQPGAASSSGGDASAMMSPFYASAAFASSLMSPHPHHGLLSPLHAAMGFQPPASSSASASSASALASAPSPVITMADMMAGDPTLLLTSPTAAGMFKHLLPTYAAHPPPPLSTSTTAPMSVPASTSPSMLMAMPPATANVKDMTLNELRPHFNKPMAVVAKELGVCITLMKKICRRNGLVRWPHRRIRSLVNRITSLQVIAASATGAEKKRFQSQIGALREELSAVIQNPNEKSRKAQADARARSPSGMPIQDDADTEASLSAMLRDCGGGLGGTANAYEAASSDENEAVATTDDVKPAKGKATSSTDKKSKKKSKSKKKKAENAKGTSEHSNATIEPLAALDSPAMKEEESPRTVSDPLGTARLQGKETDSAVVGMRPTKKRKRVGGRFGNALPPPPIKIPRLDEQPDRPRCHSAPERRARDKKKTKRNGDGSTDASDSSPKRSSCVRPATTTNRGKRGSISSILCHAVDQL